MMPLHLKETELLRMLPGLWPAVAVIENAVMLSDDVEASRDAR